MTPERLAEIESRADAATEGPWKHTHYDVRDEHDVNLDARRCAGKCPGKMGCECTYLLSNCILSSNDAAFIAHARTDIPALIAEVKRLNAVLQEACGLMTESITEIERLREDNQG